jgi:quercetin dioxygenase-like cupin family protein
MKDFGPNKSYTKFNEDNIEKKIFDDRWVKFAFGTQGFLNTDKFNLGIVKFDKNKTSKTHMHNVEEVLYVISGKGKIKINNSLIDVKESDFLHIQKNTEHTIITKEDSELKILFIFSDKIIIED